MRGRIDMCSHVGSEMNRLEGAHVFLNGHRFRDDRPLISRPYWHVFFYEVRKIDKTFHCTGLH